jgi:tetratricopeptide (TPR) repeat protein
MGSAMRRANNIRRFAIGLPCVAVFLIVVHSPAVGQLLPMQSSPKKAPTANAAPPEARRYAAPQKNGPLYQGQPVRWPKMPFARNRGAAQAPARNATPVASQPAPSMGAQGSRFATAPRPSAAIPVQQYAAPRATATDRVASRPTAPQTSRPTKPSGPPSVTITSPAPRPQLSPAEQLATKAHQLSVSAQSEADYTQIIEACRRAATSRPSPEIARYCANLSAWALNRRGQLNADAGRDADALRDFEEAVAADPQRWRAIHNRGVLLAQAGDYSRAFDDFNSTIKLQPRFAKAYSNRAALFEVAGQIPKALDDFQRAAELDPKLAVAHRGQGRACHLLGRLNEAIRCYDLAVRLAPNDTFAIASRAAVLTDLGRYREAAAGYEKSIQLDPKSSYALGGSAWLLATCPDDAVRNPAVAIQRAQAAIDLTGGDEAASFDTLAAAQANAGDFTAAVNTIRRAVDLASAEEREVYQDRMHIYQNARPYRIAPVEPVTQTSYESN